MRHFHLWNLACGQSQLVLDPNPSVQYGIYHKLAEFSSLSQAIEMCGGRDMDCILAQCAQLLPLFPNWMQSKCHWRQPPQLIQIQTSTVGR